MLDTIQTPAGKSKWTPKIARQLIKDGLSYGEFEGLQTHLSLPAAQLAELTGMHPRTLQRRRKEGVFTFVESDRLFRYLDLFQRASAALESEDAAAAWLKRANPYFDGLSPLEYAATEPGYQELLLDIESIADDSFG